MATGVQKNEQKHQHRKGAASERKCQVAGCKDKYRAKGYCNRHYRMWRRGLFGKSFYRSCAKKGDKKCTKPEFAEGLCKEHFEEVVKQRAAKRGESAPAAAAAAPAAAPAAAAEAPAAEAPADKPAEAGGEEDAAEAPSES